MTIGVLAPRPRLVVSPLCAGCDTYPCVCQVDRSPRTEGCACGGSLVVADRSDWAAIAAVVVIHNRSTGHLQAMKRMGWR